jgi:glycosyltransferase involved in cell wall biosynthesis
MKHLLLISYFFPPHGGGGVLRPLEMVRLLEARGWESLVLAGPGEGYWRLDPELALRVPSGAEVRRTRALGGPGLLARLRGAAGGRGEGRSEGTIRALRRLTDWLPVPDVYCGWIPFARRAGLELARRADCILSTSPPESAHLVASRVARRTGLPWVADFRDPWVRGIYRHYPTRSHERWQKHLERLIVESADRVIANTAPALEDFRARYPREPQDKFQLLPNGFDPQEFSALGRKAPGRGPLRIIHAGGLTLGRDPGPFLEALGRVNRSAGSAEQGCRLELVGPVDPRFLEKARALGLGESVTASGWLTRAETLERLAFSHLALLLESFRPGAELVAPMKLYDYLGAGVPVLAVVPEGAASRLLGETGGGMTVTSADSGKIEEALRGILARFRQGEPLVPPVDRSAAARFERPAQMDFLAGLLDSLT